ncbi:cyclin b2 [Chrysochromulina tobinii]|uniref:Cyclin b2 n=1 Tax=Chrysochromulina tobinii TaxID=1460289 RepID=A0A0M0JZA6_9EUKA|nr:cyclin b2 [Chrysochromulina tobinii]|eukprot:KOO31961.1 cyclin b2 [Chrysochromulina sp. CCMP291]
MASLIAQAAPLRTDPELLIKLQAYNFDHRCREKVMMYINELSEDFGLLVQTSSMACNYFDRYILEALRAGPVSHHQMQMIATTCVLISAKFIDRKLPPLSELVKVHNQTATAEQFAALERVIVVALEWNLHVLLPQSFLKPLRATLPGAPFSRLDEQRTQFFMDLSVYDGHLLQYTPAEVCGGSLLAAWKFSSETEAIACFLPALAHSLHTTELRLKRCTNQLLRYYQFAAGALPVLTAQAAALGAAPAAGRVVMGAGRVVMGAGRVGSPDTTREIDGLKSLLCDENDMLDDMLASVDEDRFSPDTVMMDFFCAPN